MKASDVAAGDNVTRDATTQQADVDKGHIIESSVAVRASQLKQNATKLAQSFDRATLWTTQRQRVTVARIPMAPLMLTVAPFGMDWVGMDIWC